MRGTLESCIREDRGPCRSGAPLFLAPQLAYLFGFGQSENSLSNRAASDLDNEISASQVWVGEDHGLGPALLKEPLNRAIAIYPGIFLHAHGAQCT